MLTNADEAPTEAIVKVSPGTWRCYGTEMEWNALHNRTWCWLGEWPSKPRVHYQLDTWFELRGATLVPTRVVLADTQAGHIWSPGPRSGRRCFECAPCVGYDVVALPNFYVHESFMVIVSFASGLQAGRRQFDSIISAAFIFNTGNCL
jgi:hypothetical protein